MKSAGLYVHLPWCTRKCPYCDFNSYQARGALAEDDYVDALLLDLGHELRGNEAVGISSIFIGGGTPSLFSGPAIARLMDGIAERATLLGDIEVTLEANPGSAEAARFREYRAAGVNRLSLGIQSFDDQKLAALGRVHGAAEALAAIEAARQANFTNFNLDLMFGLPGATRGDALRDLSLAVDAQPTHISWYQLTMEPGTAFARNPPSLPTHDEICDDYDAGLQLLAGAGYDHYEISAHARNAMQARHNVNYWEFGDYIGIGAGAHGKLTGAAGIVRRSKHRQPEHYVKAVQTGSAVAHEEGVGKARVLTDYMLNVLRLRHGFSLTELTRKTGIMPADPLLELPLTAAFAQHWLERAGDRVRPTTLGFRFLNDLQMLFVDGGDVDD